MGLLFERAGIDYNKQRLSLMFLQCNYHMALFSFQGDNFLISSSCSLPFVQQIKWVFSKILCLSPLFSSRSMEEIWKTELQILEKKTKQNKKTTVVLKIAV